VNPSQGTELLELQELDRRLDALNAERRSLLAGEPWKELERQTRVLRQRVEALEARRAELERRQRLADLDRQGAEEERRRLEQRLYGGQVRNPRDLEGLQRNIEGVAARVSQLETEILEAMEELDRVAAELRDARERLGHAEALLTRRRSEGAARLAAAESELRQTTRRREEGAARVPPALLREYERVRARTGGVAVAPVAGDTCGACGVGVSPLVRSRLRRGEGIVTCENCGRILVLA
jgi:predicted  nucleic acid-binding Zn-ribbon protein